MSTAALSSNLAMTRPPLRLHLPSSESPTSSVRWSIDGFPATILTWTAEEWRHLAEHPADARQCPNGIWCALRMD